MASIRKRGERWRAEVCLHRQRRSATFPTRARAIAWATATEHSILSGAGMAIAGKTFAEALKKYAEEISPKKAGERWEVVRLKKMAGDPLARVRLDRLDARHIAAWRERRLALVSAASVRREWNLLSAVCSVAMNEWRWLARHPMKGVAKPAPAAPRDRRVSQAEITAIQAALGYAGGTPQSKSHRVALAFEFACETALRAQEICNLRAADIEGATACVRKSKTRAGVRMAPLTPRAVEILRLLPEDLFGITPATLDALFRRAKQRAALENLHFHDSRHEGITRMATKLNALELARAVGHQDLKQLLVYYNEGADALAVKLQ